DLDSGDGGGARPGDAAHDDLAGWDLLPVAGVGDQGPDPLEGDRFPGRSVDFVPVFLRLEVAGEGTVGQLDAGQPLHRGDAVPTRHDEAYGVAVLDGERLAVHGVRQQSVGVQRGVDGQAPLEVHGICPSLERAVVGAAEDDLRCGGQDPDAV